MNLHMTTSRLLRTLTVEHRIMECARPFDEVHRALLAAVPALKPEVYEILVRGDSEKIAVARRDCRSSGSF